MIITNDGYAIEQYPKQNQIVINLPQTNSTITNTNGTIATRKEKLTTEELTLILTLVRLLMGEKGEEE